MKRVALHNLGCKVNAYETEAMQQLLEEAGYRTQLLEFIDMEHTPKNIMIRAVRRGKRPAESGREALLRLMEELHVEPALLRLLEQSGVCPSRPRPAYASPPVS